MPPDPKPSNDERPKLSKAEAMNCIHEMALDMLHIAEEAELRFLVYLLGLVIAECEPHASEPDPNSN